MLSPGLLLPVFKLWQWALWLNWRTQAQTVQPLDLHDVNDKHAVMAMLYYCGDNRSRWAAQATGWWTKRAISNIPTRFPSCSAGTHFHIDLLKVFSSVAAVLTSMSVAMTRHADSFYWLVFETCPYYMGGGGEVAAGRPLFEGLWFDSWLMPSVWLYPNLPSEAVQCVEHCMNVRRTVKHFEFSPLTSCVHATYMSKDVHNYVHTDE